jgi:hypothetical protein
MKFLLYRQRETIVSRLQVKPYLAISIVDFLRPLGLFILRYFFSVPQELFLKSRVGETRFTS